MPNFWPLVNNSPLHHRSFTTNQFDGHTNNKSFRIRLSPHSSADSHNDRPFGREWCARLKRLPHTQAHKHQHTHIHRETQIESSKSISLPFRSFDRPTGACFDGESLIVLSWLRFGTVNRPVFSVRSERVCVLALLHPSINRSCCIRPFLLAVVSLFHTQKWRQIG